jgi:hypothetical protein
VPNPPESKPPAVSPAPPPKKTTKINWSLVNHEKFNDRILEKSRAKTATSDQVDTFIAWKDENHDVPMGDWYADFGGFIIAGKGPKPSTPLADGMAPHGERVFPPKPPELTPEEQQFLEQNPTMNSADVNRIKTKFEVELDVLSHKRSRNAAEEKRFSDLTTYIKNYTKFLVILEKAGR